MDLILWRHAQAAYGGDDLARALTDKGHRQARAAAAFLRDRLPERTRVYVSQARRSRETAEYLLLPLHTLPAFNPDADARQLYGAWARLPESDCAVIVGHQPWLGELCAALLNGAWQDGQAWSVKKGAFWWFKLPSAADTLPAKLRLMLTPADLPTFSGSLKKF